MLSSLLPADHHPIRPAGAGALAAISRHLFVMKPIPAGAMGAMGRHNIIPDVTVRG